MAWVRIDLTGQRFGFLVVSNFLHNDRWGQSLWLCDCDCGGQKVARGGELRSGVTIACHRAKPVRKTHGKSKTPTHKIWMGINNRCNNPNIAGWATYGGRGISVCERWGKFENFLEDMGERPSNMDIDRIDNDGDYCPENCRWVTRSDNCRNKKYNVYLDFNGEKLLLVEWAEKLNMRYGLIHDRLRLGWTIERALTEPAGYRFRKARNARTALCSEIANCSGPCASS